MKLLNALKPTPEETLIAYNKLLHPSAIADKYNFKPDDILDSLKKMDSIELTHFYHEILALLDKHKIK